jgi:hypothetical protein
MACPKLALLVPPICCFCVAVLPRGIPVVLPRRPISPNNDPWIAASTSAYTVVRLQQHSYGVNVVWSSMADRKWSLMRIPMASGMQQAQNIHKK